MSTNRPLVIGLAGAARAGKDTVGRLLVEQHGFTRVVFADGIREAALALDPLIKIPSGDTVRLSNVVDFYGWDQAKAIPEVRRTLQRIGSEAGWMIHGQDLWIDLAAKKIGQVHTGSHSIRKVINGQLTHGEDLWAHTSESFRSTVITDVRFAHEVAWLDSIGGVLWRIERPDSELALSGETATHASEAGDLGREPDAVIVNDGSLNDLTVVVEGEFSRLESSRTRGEEVSGHPEPWPHDPAPRPITEVLSDFDDAACGRADIDIRAVLWELLHDVADSYSLALAEQTALTPQQIAGVNTTVSDYLSNTYL